MEKWMSDLNRLVNRKKVSISSYNSDQYNYRVGDSMGCEDDYDGFTAVIFYFQLSSNIDIDNVKKVVLSIDRNVNRYRKTKLCTLFLNNENYELIHPKNVVYNHNQVANVIDEYYLKYSIDNQGYSNKLYEIFPPISLYSRNRHPSSEDLCVIFHDDKGISIDDDIREKVLRLRRRFIFVNVSKNQEISVMDGLNIIK